MLTVNLLINRRTDVVWKYCVFNSRIPFLFSDKYEYLEYIVLSPSLCIKMKNRVLNDLMFLAH